MKARRSIIALFMTILLLGLIPYAQAADSTPPASTAPHQSSDVVADAYCVGTDLYVVAAVGAGRTHLSIRVNGNGPNLPTDPQGPGATTYTFIIPGPGSWENLDLQVPGDDPGTWGNPTDLLVAPTNIECLGPVYAPGCAFTDNRLNDDVARDCAPPVVLYCINDHLHIYQIDLETSKGFLVLDVNLGNLGDAPTENKILANAKRVIVSLLTSGEVQVNSWYYDVYWENNSKPYVVVFDGCPMTYAETIES